MFPHLKGFNLQKWNRRKSCRLGQRRVIWQDSDFIRLCHARPNRRRIIISIRATRYFTSSKVSSTYTTSKTTSTKLRCSMRRYLSLCPRTYPLAAPRGRIVDLRVERQRGKEEIDRFIWPCEKCGNNLYETEVRFDDPGDAVSRATNSLKSNPALVTCKQCGEVLDL